MTDISAYPRRFLNFVNEKFGIEFFKISVVLATIYAAQGSQSLTSIPLLFYFKDVLKFTDVQLQYFTAVTSFAWLMKPFFGFISDRFPIFGYRRKTYMVLMALIAANSWWLLAFMAYAEYTKYAVLILVFNFSSLGYAFVDVVCDAIMVERGQKFNKEKFFVNLQWFALGIASAIAGFCGGWMQSLIKSGDLQIYYVFIITGFIPCISATISWFFVQEEKIKKCDEKLSQPENFENNAKEKSITGIFKEILTSKIFWVLSAFIFFWKFSPSFGAAFSYYTIDILKFDEIFLGVNTGIGNAIFPLAIVLYMGLLKWFPQIKAKHYLYASIAIGVIYYVVNLLYFVPESIFSHTLNINVPGGNMPWWKWFLGLTIYIWLINAAYYRLIKKRYNWKYGPVAAKARFYLIWLVILPISVPTCLAAAGIPLTPLALTYKSIYVLNNVIFSYATIASFLIPLSLAAELAPKKAEGMTYAYFMALSNIAGAFLSNIVGGKMIDILKTMLRHPETTISLNFNAIIIVLLGIALIAFCALIIIKKFIAQKKWIFISLCGMLLAIIAYCFGPIFIAQLKTSAAWMIQQSYFIFKPLIGDANWLGQEAYRALILRYSVIIGIIFVLFSTIFVYLLPSDTDKKKN